MRTYELLAPAKVNLILRVLGRRPDGFHDLDTLMVPISLADRLRITVGGEGIRVEVPDRPELEGDSNLCAQAARAFERLVGLPARVHVVLEKRIPVAGGLGGGSSDAAAVLRVLAHHHGVAADDPRLWEAALSVGSDVPFFLRCTPALARGRGEHLSDAPALPEPLHLVIVHPPFGVSAKEAYQTLAKGRQGAPPQSLQPRPLPPSLPTPEAVAVALHNDLQPGVEGFRPIADCVERLLETGLPGALMSGSGSCVFGVARDEDDAARSGASFRMRPNEVILLAHTLQRAPKMRETIGQP